MALRVVVVEDNTRFREALALVLQHTPGFELAAAFKSVEAMDEVLQAPRSPAHAWEVVLMDLDLPGASGIEGIRRLRAALPRVAVLVCTVFEEPATIVDAIGAGADGYLLKGVSLDELLEQIRIVAGGGSSVSPSVARTLLEVVRQQTPRPAPSSGPARLNLTDRERDVLRGLVDGLSYKQVADRLSISQNTVRTHIRGLYRKLQVQNVAEAVSRAVREQLV